MANEKDLCDEEKIENWIKKGVKKLEKMDCGDKKGIKKYGDSGISGWVAFMGFIGALVYFLQQATSFGTVVAGFLKAIVWPAYLIFNLLTFLKV